MTLVAGSSVRFWTVWLWMAVAAAGTRAAEGARVRWREKLTTIADHLDAIETALAREIDRSLGGKPIQTMDFSLKKAVLGKDVSLSLSRTPVLGIRGTLHVPVLNREPVEVDARSLDVQGDAKTGAAKGTFPVTLRRGVDWDGMVQDMLGNVDALTVEVSLTVGWEDGQAAGTYRFEPQAIPADDGRKEPSPSPLSATGGPVSGVVRAAAKAEEPRSRALLFTGSAGPGDLYLDARRMEQAADRCYARVRALNLARTQGLSFDGAAREVLVPRAVRPPLRLGAGEGDADTGSPAADGERPELDLGGVADEEPVSRSMGKTNKPKGSKPASELDRALGETVAIAARLQSMRRVLENYDGTSGSAPPVVRDTLATDDPEFGPWYGEDSLTIAEVDLNVLPDDAGAEGPQEWPCVAAWRAMGPFAIRRFDLVTPLLPDAIWTGDETCRVERDRLRDYTGPDEAAWKACPAPARGDFGYIVPPKWFSFNPYYRGLPPVLGYREYQNQGHYGLPHSTAYLRCRIRSPRDAELWAGVGVNQQGRLWIEDRLLWEAPSRVDPLRTESVGLIRIPFKAGVNRLTLRIDVDFSSPFCWLRVCVRGTPRSGQEVRAKSEAVAAMRRAMKPERAVGWRGDGTGLYPGTHPPVAWHQKRKENILWHTPLPYFGNATPVPAPGTNRLFVTIDPHWLACLDKDTGRELWRRAVTLLDLLPEPERKRGWELHEAWWKARQARDSVPVAEVQGMKHKVPKWLQYQWYWAEGAGIWVRGKRKAKDEREGASPELVALLDKRDELEKAPDPASVQDEMNRVLKQIETLQSKTATDDPNSPQAIQARLDKAEREYVRHLRKFSHVEGMGGGYWEDYCGWMFATPVSDGRRVWLKTGADVAACFDMDGNEIWKVQTWGAGGADHTLCSPRLAGDRFVMQLLDRDPDPADTRRRGVKLVTLDAATGAKAWETRDLSDHAWNDSTPGVITLTDGRDCVRALVTTCGTLVRLDDGKVLVRNPGVQGGFASPLVCDDVVIFGHAALAPIQYIMAGRDRVGFRRLWAVRGGAHGLLDSGGGLLVDGRILHTVGIRADARRGGEGIAALGLRAEAGVAEGWRAAEGYDLATGAHAGAIPILRKGGNQWTPACASERHVYHYLGDHIFQHIGPKAPMDVVTVTREAVPLRLANNAADRSYGAATIEGDRLYIRGYYGATCIGYTGDAGRRYEAQTVARNLLDDAYPERPKGGRVVEVSMSRESAIRDYPYQHKRNVFGAPRNCLVLNGFAPHRWWIAGPVPAASAGEALAAFGGPTQVLQGDETFKVGGKEYGFGPLSQTYLERPDFREWELDPNNFADIHRLRRVVDLGKATGAPTNGVCFVMTEWRSDCGQTMRLDLFPDWVRAWVGGQEVRAGDRVRFGEGVCQMLLQAPVDRRPADGLWLSPRFWDAGDPGREEAAWVGYAKRIRPYLENAVRLAPDSPVAVAAGKFLASLE